MEKVCKQCKVNKPLEEFNKAKYGKYGYASKCRVCIKQRYSDNKEYFQSWHKKYYGKNKDKIKQRFQNRREEVLEYNKQWYQDSKDGLHYVYLIENDNHAGTTNFPHRRRNEHRHRLQEEPNMRILYTTPNREEALELEEFLHDLGYNGRSKSYI